MIQAAAKSDAAATRRDLAILTIFPNCRPVDVVCFGIDFGKTVFHLVGLDLSGKVVVRKRLCRPLRSAPDSLRDRDIQHPGKPGFVM